ncbi:MAG: DTW domain-containing protein, partial [Planctomycetes bacterium]|nr:DTW domain-containing protein [Planctomycetota bacterium]
HPHERLHPFGTAKLIRLGMPNARVHTVCPGVDRSLHCPLELPDDAVLLYPHPDAIELEALANAPGEAPPSTLVVLDGTWSHARSLYRENPWLGRLRHVRITPQQPSRYRIRKEPRPEYLSTLEATICALRALEPEASAARLDALLAAFDGMIDRQIDHIATGARELRRKRPRQREPRRVSPLIGDPDFVVLYAESSLPGGDDDATRELVQVVGARIDGSRAFELLIRPSARPPTDAHLHHMGLERSDLEAGVSLAEAREQFAELAGPGPFGAWTRSSLDWSAPLLPQEAGRSVLKTSYCNLQNDGSRRLEAVVRTRNLVAPKVDCRGRAAVRLANALAVARWIGNHAAGSSPCS